MPKFTFSHYDGYLFQFGHRRNKCSNVQMSPYFPPTVSSTTNGAGLPTSFIAASSARAPSALVWKIIPLKMEITFDLN